MLNFTGKRSILHFGVRFVRFKLQSGPKIGNLLLLFIIVNHDLFATDVTLRVEVGGDVVLDNSLMCKIVVHPNLGIFKGKLGCV